MSDLKTQTLGFPRIGREREMKRALERFWKGKLEAKQLLDTLHQVEEDAWKTQGDSGIDFIGVGDGTLYDPLLDWAVRLGLIPRRFQGLEGLELSFAMARGKPGVAALELTKWFDTNYHYLVPELDAETRPSANFDAYLDTIRRAQATLGDRAIPIVLGPVTLLRLSRIKDSFDDLLGALLPLYRDLLTQLHGLGVPEVQIHEPGIMLGDAPEHREHYETAYAELTQAGLPINLVTFFDDLGAAFPWVTALPVAAITLDFTKGDNLALLESNGWPEGRTLGAGVIDGRSAWQLRPGDGLALVEALAAHAPLRLSMSCSLQFVPYEAARESGLPDELRNVLAFGQEKLHELRLLGQAASSGGSTDDLKALDAAWERFRAFAPAEPHVQQQTEALTPEDFVREVPYGERRSEQIQLPPLPTTTIGSFPQTVEVRRLRRRFKRGEITPEAYEAGIDAWIGYTIGAQEAMGLDVLVHGEFERSDMVEYFAEKMKGFAFTEHGWVQSYGNRYVRPPIIFADVVRKGPMTVREFQKAQSFTTKPVKGMLTGPVTILNWSYPRTDISAREITLQLALAIQEEIADLETAGARVIQVDEPALREGLPFKPEKWDDYLTWAVDSFRLATSRARPDTQIHTHMCYSDFGEILGAIDRLNADVISIENARSDDATLRELGQYGYSREVGPGVYDVHSPVVPGKEEIKVKLRSYLKHLAANQIWVNPDCGLKTRGWDKVFPALNHIVEAVREVRGEIQTGRE